MIIKPIKEKYKTNKLDYEVSNLVLDEDKGKGKAILIGYADGKPYSYEAVILRLSKLSGSFTKLKTYEGFTHFWRLPSNEDFGYYGWSHSKESLAIEKYNSI